MSHIIPCDTDKLQGYRNKVEFTIGRQYAGAGKEGPLTVGFSQGNLTKGIMFTGLADNITVISKESLYVAKKVEQVVQEINQKHGIEHYSKTKNEGFWRLVLYRESKQTKQVLISVIVSEPKEGTPIDEIKSAILSKFEDKKIPGDHDLEIMSISIIYSTELSGGYKEGDKSELLFGNSMSYEEEIYGFRFTVSPFAFFQVNNSVFEKMLAEMENFLNMQENTILFDVCCGTGAIGICLSKKASKVVGFELVEAAVKNAEENVAINGNLIDAGKCQFHAGRAEYTMPTIAKEFSDKTSTIVGIVDPPREGLHRDVLRAIRCCKGLNRLVYVSCNAESQMRDLQYLCYAAEKKRPAPPFIPIKCVGADLFPMTNHVESMVFLERAEH